jgi:hypothetical protein
MNLVVIAVAVGDRLKMVKQRDLSRMQSLERASQSLLAGGCCTDR